MRKQLTFFAIVLFFERDDSGFATVTGVAALAASTLAPTSNPPVGAGVDRDPSTIANTFAAQTTDFEFGHIIRVEDVHPSWPRPLKALPIGGVNDHFHLVGMFRLKPKRFRALCMSRRGQAGA